MARGGCFSSRWLAVCLVAVVDAALGSRAVLVEFLIIGPLIAAIGALGAQTTIVSLITITWRFRSAS